MSMCISALKEKVTHLQMIKHQIHSVNFDNSVLVLQGLSLGEVWTPDLYTICDHCEFSRCSAGLSLCDIFLHLHH